MFGTATLSVAKVKDLLQTTVRGNAQAEKWRPNGPE